MTNTELAVMTLATTTVTGEGDFELALLFTDIEGSTRLLQLLGPKYYDTLNIHNNVIRELLKSRGGEEVSTAGDSFFAVFADPGAAIAATVDAQRSLARQRWPDDTPVRVRMGLHLGKVHFSPGQGYRGLDVHRAARISAAGHGGQVLISEAMRAAVRILQPA